MDPAAAAAVALLVASLLEDPAVRQQIERDPQLQAPLADPTVRQHIVGPAMQQGMTGLFELVRILVDDSAVQGRVQSDATLRSLWADPAVRRHIQQRGQH